MQTEGGTENEVAEETGWCLKYAPNRKGGGGRNSASDKADTSGQKDKRNDQHSRRKSMKWTVTLKLDREYEVPNILEFAKTVEVCRCSIGLFTEFLSSILLHLSHHWFLLVTKLLLSLLVI